MNREEIAIELLKHPLIKKINESRLWDRPVVSRVIAEEIMREAEEDRKLKKATERAKNGNKSMLLRLKGEAEKKLERLKNATVLATPDENKKKELEKYIVKIEGILKQYEDNVVPAASATKTKKDDDAVATTLNNIETEIEATKKMSNDTTDDEVKAGLVKDLTTSSVSNIKDAAKAVKDAKEKEEATVDNNNAANTEEKDIPQEILTFLKIIAPATVLFMSPVASVLTNIGLNAADEGYGRVKDFYEENKGTIDRAHDEYKKGKYGDAVSTLGTLSGEDSTFNTIADKLANALSTEGSDENKKDAVEKEVNSIKDASEDDKQQAPLATGWSNAKSSVANKLKKVANEGEDPIEFVTNSLESIDKFVDAWNPKKDREKTYEQLKDLWDTGAIEDIVERIKKNAEVDQKTNKQPETENATNAIATIMSYAEYINSQNVSFLTPEMVKSVFEKEIPKDEEEFKNNFLVPIAKEIEKEAKPSDKGYLLIADQVLKTYPNILDKVGGDTDNNKHFMGWFVAEKSKEFEKDKQEQLQEAEGIEQNLGEYYRYVGEYRNKHGDREFLSKFLKGKSAHWKEILEKLEELVKTGEIKIDIDSIKGEDPEESPNTKKQIATTQVDGQEGTDPKAGETVEPVPKEVVQTEVEEIPEVEKVEYDEQIKENLTTFFADKGAKGLGFMQQILLRDQAEQLWTLIGDLNKIIKREYLIDGGDEEEQALTAGEPPEQGSDDSPEKPEQGNLQEQQLELFDEDKINIKKRLTGMVTLLRDIRQTSRNYEKYMTRSSRDPRFDGSSLKKQLDAQLPEIQRLISEMISDLKKYTGNERVNESLLNEQDIDREQKIQIVKERYIEMRRIWQVMKPVYDGGEEPTGGLKLKAEEMKKIATDKEFISLFPNVVNVSNGEVVSIGQANKALSGTIEDFVFAMRDVLTLVKGGMEKKSVTVVIGKLNAIASAIYKNFGVKVHNLEQAVEVVAEEAKRNPEQESYTIIPFEQRIGTFRKIWEKVKQTSKDLFKKMLEKFQKLREAWARLKKMNNPVLEEEVMASITAIEGSREEKINKVVEGLMVLTQTLEAIPPKQRNKIIKLLTTKKEDPQKSQPGEDVTIDLSQTEEGRYGFVQDYDVKINSYEKKLVDKVVELVEESTKGTSRLEGFMKKIREFILMISLLVMRRKPKKDNKEVTHSPQQNDNLQEKLKPIIAEMLKEYYGQEKFNY